MAQMSTKPNFIEATFPLGEIKSQRVQRLPGTSAHLRRLLATAAVSRLLDRVEGVEDLFLVEPPTPAHAQGAEDAASHKSLNSPAVAAEVDGQLVRGSHADGDAPERGGGGSKIHVHHLPVSIVRVVVPDGNNEIRSPSSVLHLCSINGDLEQAIDNRVLVIAFS